MKVYIEKDWNTRSSKFYLEYEAHGKTKFIGSKDNELIEQIIDDNNASIVPIVPLFGAALSLWVVNKGVNYIINTLMIKLKDTISEFKELKKDV